jgi:hypothetical protein
MLIPGRLWNETQKIREQKLNSKMLASFFLGNPKRKNVSS